jgi:hypothetical protein
MKCIDKAITIPYIQILIFCASVNFADCCLNDCPISRINIDVFIIKTNPQIIVIPIFIPSPFSSSACEKFHGKPFKPFRCPCTVLCYYFHKLNPYYYYSYALVKNFTENRYTVHGYYTVHY